MRALGTIFMIGFFIIGCSSLKQETTNYSNQEEAVVIANDSLEYEIIILDVGFKAYLNSIAQPATFYSQQFYETRNRLYVSEWNIRVNNPIKYDASIYQNRIDYDFNINYGLDVNYKLYNYFRFVEYKYNQNFFLTRKAPM